MSELEVGDHVLAANNMYSRVYTFGHRVKSTRAEYLQILPFGLELSADHMIFVLDKGAIPASIDNPRGNFTGDPYFTDGYRLVLWVTSTPVDINDIEEVRWSVPRGL